jgi:hypothetical protein
MFLLCSTDFDAVNKKSGLAQTSCQASLARLQGRRTYKRGAAGRPERELDRLSAYESFYFLNERR